MRRPETIIAADELNADQLRRINKARNAIDSPEASLEYKIPDEFDFDEFAELTAVIKKARRNRFGGEQLRRGLAIYLGELLQLERPEAELRYSFNDKALSRVFLDHVNLSNIVGKAVGDRRSLLAAYNEAREQLGWDRFNRFSGI